MYYHLTKETRIKFSALLMAGLSLRQAAKLLGVHHTTLSRELQRNRPVRNNFKYHPGDAHRKTTARRLIANQHFRKIVSDSRLAQIIIERISIWKWAPEQIAGWLKTYRRSLYVCAQTIYDWVYRFRQDLVSFLHCQKGKLRRTRLAKVRKDKRARLANVRSIANRPKYIQLRKSYGHWEGDTVHGKGKTGYIATFVERKSGYLMAAYLPASNYSSFSFANATAQCMNQIPASYRKTLTLDNGPEMKAPERIERATKMKVFYANPYHSWERGTNENTNGLLRYFFPKKTSFASLSQKDLDLAVNLINTRPRKRHNWRTPKQMLKI
jgi:IS30 family transposase